MENSKADKESMSYGGKTSHASRRILAVWFILVLSWFDTGGEAYGACKSDKRVV